MVYVRLFADNVMKSAPCLLRMGETETKSFSHDEQLGTRFQVPDERNVEGRRACQKRRQGGKKRAGDPLA